MLFKDEVRARRRRAGPARADRLAPALPGPRPRRSASSAARSTSERLEILRDADAILQEEVRAAGLYRDLWQSFCVLPVVRSVGVQGDGRTYAYPIVIRAVTSDDAMTADWARLPYDLLERVSSAGSSTRSAGSTASRSTSPRSRRRRSSGSSDCDPRSRGPRMAGFAGRAVRDQGESAVGPGVRELFEVLNARGTKAKHCFASGPAAGPQRPRSCRWSISSNSSNFQTTRGPFARISRRAKPTGALSRPRRPPSPAMTQPRAGAVPSGGERRYSPVSSSCPTSSGAASGRARCRPRTSRGRPHLEVQVAAGALPVSPS